MLSVFSFFSFCDTTFQSFCQGCGDKDSTPPTISSRRPHIDIYGAVRCWLWERLTLLCITSTLSHWCEVPDGIIGCEADKSIGVFGKWNKEACALRLFSAIEENETVYRPEDLAGGVCVCVSPILKGTTWCLVLKANSNLISHEASITALFVSIITVLTRRLPWILVLCLDSLLDLWRRLSELSFLSHLSSPRTIRHCLQNPLFGTNETHCPQWIDPVCVFQQ